MKDILNTLLEKHSNSSEIKEYITFILSDEPILKTLSNIILVYNIINKSNKQKESFSINTQFDEFILIFLMKNKKQLKLTCIEKCLNRKSKPNQSSRLELEEEFDFKDLINDLLTMIYYIIKPENQKNHFSFIILESVYLFLIASSKQQEEDISIKSIVISYIYFFNRLLDNQIFFKKTEFENKEINTILNYLELIINNKSYKKSYYLTTSTTKTVVSLLKRNDFLQSKLKLIIKSFSEDLLKIVPFFLEKIDLTCQKKRRMKQIETVSKLNVINMLDIANGNEKYDDYLDFNHSQLESIIQYFLLVLTLFYRKKHNEGQNEGDVSKVGNCSLDFNPSEDLERINTINDIILVFVNRPFCKGMIFLNSHIQERVISLLVVLIETVMSTIKNNNKFDTSRLKVSVNKIIYISSKLLDLDSLNKVFIYSYSKLVYLNEKLFVDKEECQNENGHIEMKLIETGKSVYSILGLEN